MKANHTEWRNLYVYRYAAARTIYARDMVSKDGLCAICKKPDEGKQSSALMIHHFTYRNGNPGPRTWQRLNEYHADPSNFALLCRGCHGTLTRILYDPGIIERLLAMVSASERSR